MPLQQQPQPQPHDPTHPWRTYRILRGEQGVLTYEPYKSALLPLWRFRTAAIAATSATALGDRFVAYESQRDFVGMDMCRKFLQMGMTRSKRYANHKGGRKYGNNKKADDKAGNNGGDGGGEVVRVRREEEGEEWEGKREKEEASLVFREVWERVKGREGYKRAKEEFLARQRGWDREEKGRKRGVREDAEDGAEGDEEKGEKRNSRKRKRR